MKALAPLLLATVASAPAHAESTRAAREDRIVYGALGGGSAGLEERAGLFLPLDFAAEAVAGSYGKEDLLLVRGKKFLGNSFYVAAETGIGRWRGDDPAAEPMRVGRVGLSLGNEWILWRHVILGCEWVGYTRDRNVDVARGREDAAQVATLTSWRHLTGSLGVTF